MEDFFFNKLSMMENWLVLESSERKYLLIKKNPNNTNRH